ncbi:MAG: chemotaxis protein CheW [Alphaproteobacteria bacterium]
MTVLAQALVFFQCGGAICALPHFAVAQIAATPRLAVPPGLPRPLLGFANVGGRAVPVLDGRRLLGVGDTAAPDIFDSHLLVLADRIEPAALLVDRVLDVRPVPADAAMPVRAETTLNDCVAAEIEDAGGTVSLLAPDRILFAAEKARLADLRAAVQARLDEWSAVPA